MYSLGLTANTTWGDLKEYARRLSEPAPLPEPTTEAAPVPVSDPGLLPVATTTITGRVPYYPEGPIPTPIENVRAGNGGVVEYPGPVHVERVSEVVPEALRAGVGGTSQVLALAVVVGLTFALLRGGDGRV